MEELGRAKPNGGVMYLGIDEQILSLLCRNTRGGIRSLENF
jgi:hypothetical protein